MGICNVQIKTDLKNKTYNADKACKQCDTLILNFNIFDNSIMADLTGFVCDLRANKADGKGYQIVNNITVITSTGGATIKCPSSLTQFAGLLKLELTFTDTVNGLQKTTFDINIQVDKSVIANDDGSVPTIIITAVEEVNKTLSQIAGKVSEATQINNALTNTNTNANNLNNTLQTTINNANISKSNLDNSKIVADTSKAALDSSVLLAEQFISFVDDLSRGAPVTTETDENITIETGEVWTL